MEDRTEYFNGAKKFFGIILLLGILLAVVASCSRKSAQDAEKELVGTFPAEQDAGKNPEMLKVGSKAPDFTLPDQDGNDVKLSDRTKDGLVLLAFYPKDNSPICTKEMTEFRDAHDEFEKLGVQILGISTNSQESHQNFKRKNELPFPLLSDESGKVSKSYGVYNKLMGISQRSYFLVDGDDVIQYEFVEKANINHRDNETLLKEARKVIQKKE